MTLLQWIVFGETGVSSKTMWAALLGVVTDGNKGGLFDVPHDKDDFKRCYKLYNECGLSKTDLEKVSTVFPWWKPFIENWETLCEMCQAGSQMHEYISKLELESRNIAGWVEVEPGHWKLIKN